MGGDLLEYFVRSFHEPFIPKTIPEIITSFSSLTISFSFFKIITTFSFFLLTFFNNYLSPFFNNYLYFI